MRESLLKKRYGIPLFIIVILIVAGIAAAAFVWIFKVQVTVNRPVSERATTSFTKGPGDSIDTYRTLDLALPDNFNLTYTLTGDAENYLKNERAKIWVDMDDNGNFDDSELKTIDTIGDNVTFDNVGPGQIQHKIKILAKVTDNTVATVEYTSGEDNLDTTTSLTVSMTTTEE